MARAKHNLMTPVLIGGCIVLLIGFGVRASFGVFQIPVADQFGWPRAEFSFAIAIQNLAWGIGQPIFAAIAEKWGDRLAIIGGVMLYAFGMVMSAFAISPEAHQLLALFVGFGVAGTGFGVVLAVVGRAATDENRSMSLGIATAAGSGGQVFGPPLAAYLLQIMNWSQVFLVFAALIMMILLFLPMMHSTQPISKSALEESMGTILKRAFKDPSYTLIFIGFFSCGYQLAFITAHFPAFVTEACANIDPSGMLAAIGVDSPATLGAFAISVIGMANIAGSLTAGWLGKRWSRKYLLSGIYLGRTIAAGLFIALPMTPTTVLIFSAVMGMLWLATIPLTSGLVAYIYGVRYMGTLYGIVFLSHQLGSFVGVWLGGKLYDLYGSYDIVWWVGVGVGLFSAIVHLPIREAPRKAQIAA